MLLYILKRLAIWVPTVILVVLGVYALAFYGAGDPIKLIFMRAPGDVAYDTVRIEAIREQAGLNQPFLQQFHEMQRRRLAQLGRLDGNAHGQILARMKRLPIARSGKVGNGRL